ncbi:MAG: glycosyltransferase, partial [Actinomycetales bacterium]|nr:glycosyltransferase [Actinomycetales bacterium]
MRIAHVSDCYLPRTGGIETQVRSLALAQAARGHDVRIITASPGHGDVRSGRDIVDGLSVERIAVSLPGEIPIHPRTRTRVVESLIANPVDVIHVHAGVVSPFAWGGVRAAHELTIPTVVTVHSVWGPLARPAFGASNSLVRWASWGVVLSAVSQVAADRVSQAVGVDVDVLPNGIDASAWRP